MFVRGHAAARVAEARIDKTDRSSNRFQSQQPGMNTDTQLLQQTAGSSANY